MIGFPVKMGDFLRTFGRDERGATAIEYALIASGIFIAIIIAVNTMATNINIMYDSIASNVATAI